MQRLKGYDKAQAYTDSEKLPTGGYVLKILNVDIQHYDWGDMLLLSFDIDEGDYAGFYNRNYHAQTQEDKKWKGTYRLRIPSEDGSEQDDWAMRRFKTVMTAFEESNPGFHWDWDEQTLKGKLIGGIFNDKEYEVNGRTGFYTACNRMTTVEKIRKGEYKIPEATLLKNKTAASSSPTSTDQFINIPDGIEEEVPFD